MVGLALILFMENAQKLKINKMIKTLALNGPFAILGFGDEGQSGLEFLQKQGFSDITICDQKEKVEVPEGVKVRLGKDAFENLSQFKTIIRSPGVYYKLPGILEAKAKGALVTSMTEMTLEVGRDRLTAITGSNGKTTTTGMIDAILTRHYDGKNIVGGNDRLPVLQRALEHPEQPILMEVSSFQFADLKLSPHISGVLNIKPNHMDWHEDMEDYINAKGNLIAHQTNDDWAVLNANDENSAQLAEHAKGKIFWVGKKEGENWSVWEDGELSATALEGEIPLSRRNNGNEVKILNSSDLIVKTHPDNILFAVAVSLIHGVDPKLIKEVLSTFKGMPQRLEFVRELEGIKFYNDSSCTTPESTEVAIQAFPKGQLILLLGGSTKHSDFSFMAQQIVKTGVRVYLFGAEGSRIKATIEVEGGEDLILKLDETKEFTEIIRGAYQLAHPGDNIVLSPACASFDMFKNSKERGRLFSEIVISL